MTIDLKSRRKHSVRVSLSVLVGLTTCHLAFGDEQGALEAQAVLRCYYPCDEMVDGRAVDASGSGDFDWQTGALPPQYSHVDFLIQALDVTASKLSNPIIVRLR